MENKKDHLSERLWNYVPKKYKNLVAIILLIMSAFSVKNILNVFPSSIITFFQKGNNQINCSILSIEIPVGEIDGNNNKFSVSHIPEYIYSDGIILFESTGYSYSKSGIQMINPPTLILKSFYKDNICE